VEGDESVLEVVVHLLLVVVGGVEASTFAPDHGVAQDEALQCLAQLLVVRTEDALRDPGHLGAALGLSCYPEWTALEFGEHLQEAQQELVGVFGGDLVVGAHVCRVRGVGLADVEGLFQPQHVGDSVPVLCTVHH